MTLEMTRGWTLRGGPRRRSHRTTWSWREPRRLRGPVARRPGGRAPADRSTDGNWARAGCVFLTAVGPHHDDAHPARNRCTARGVAAARGVGASSSPRCSMLSRRPRHRRGCRRSAVATRRVRRRSACLFEGAVDVSLDHTLEVCQLLWTQQRAAYSSPELTFSDIHQMPKPLQQGGDRCGSAAR